MAKKVTSKTTTEKKATTTKKTAPKKAVTKKTTRKTAAKKSVSAKSPDNVFNTKAYKKEVNALIKANKAGKQLKYDELSDKIAIPFKLDARQIDDLIQKVEDAGISVVDENGDPSTRALKAQKITKK